MNDEQRIEALEKQVAELERRVNHLQSWIEAIHTDAAPWVAEPYSSGISTGNSLPPNIHVVCV